MLPPRSDRHRFVSINKSHAHSTTSRASYIFWRPGYITQYNPEDYKGDSALAFSILQQAFISKEIITFMVKKMTILG